MTMHQMVYRGQSPVSFTVTGEGDPYDARGIPVITASYFGVYVGFLHQSPTAFGHWRASSCCGLITAWRVVQLLRKLKRLRNRGSGLDTTLGALVQAVDGAIDEDRMRKLAEDFDITALDLDAELSRLAALWPTAPELVCFWDKLPEREQEVLAITLRSGGAASKIRLSQQLEACIAEAELSISATKLRESYEDALITAGLEPENSLRQLLADLGVTNLAYTVGFSDIGSPAYFRFDDLDREVMRELIGSHGHSTRIPLITTARDNAVPSDNYEHIGPGIAEYWHDFEDSGHPRVVHEDATWELLFVHWDREAGYLVLTLRPLGLRKRDDSEDIQLSIPALRASIGADTGLDRPLPVGTKPAWLQREFSPARRLMRSWHRHGLR